MDDLCAFAECGKPRNSRDHHNAVPGWIGRHEFEVIEPPIDWRARALAAEALLNAQRSTNDEQVQDYPVTVCAACLQASCWHGEFMCDASPSANVTVKMASELRALGREHPDNFSPEKIERVHGRFPAARRPI